MSRNEKLKMSNTNTLMIPNQKSYSSSPRTISNSATNLSNQPLYYNAVPRTKVLGSTFDKSANVTFNFGNWNASSIYPSTVNNKNLQSIYNIKGECGSGEYEKVKLNVKDFTVKTNKFGKYINTKFGKVYL